MIVQEVLRSLQREAKPQDGAIGCIGPATIAKVDVPVCQMCAYLDDKHCYCNAGPFPSQQPRAKYGRSEWTSSKGLSTGRTPRAHESYLADLTDAPSSTLELREYDVLRPFLTNGFRSAPLACLEGLSGRRDIVRRLSGSGTLVRGRGKSRSNFRRSFSM